MKKRPEVTVGGIKIGGDNPIAIQSMTNTDTADAKATAEQCIELADAGSELVRITVNSNMAAPRVPEIRKILDESGYKNLPIIGDFHFNGHTLLKEFPEMAQALDKYRINPGNVKGFDEIIKIAIRNSKPVRIGVNWGSLDQELFTRMMEENANREEPKSDKKVIIDALVESALTSAQKAEVLGLPQNKIVLSVKMSVVQDVIDAYRLLAERMREHPYALHLGLTEAGAGMQGLISSSAALSILLQEGIGDTIRISLTPAPGASRTEEVKACRTLLQSLGRRFFRPQVTSCPGCGRTESTFFLELAKKVNDHIDESMEGWIKKYPKVTELKIAVMGCVVNGPGEAKHADIAIALPGKMEDPVAPVYIDGQFSQSLKEPNIPAQFMEILENYLRAGRAG